jgi:hypothetical protein
MANTDIVLDNGTRYPIGTEFRYTGQLHEGDPEMFVRYLNRNGDSITIKEFSINHNTGQEEEISTEDLNIREFIDEFLQRKNNNEGDLPKLIMRGGKKSRKNKKSRKHNKYNKHKKSRKQRKQRN